MTSKVGALFQAISIGTLELLMEPRRTRWSYAGRKKKEGEELQRKKRWKNSRMGEKPNSRRGRGGSNRWMRAEKDKNSSISESMGLRINRIPQLEEEKKDQIVPSLNVDRLKRRGKRLGKGCGSAQESSQNRILSPLTYGEISILTEERQGLRDAFLDITMYGRGKVNSIPTSYAQICS